MQGINIHVRKSFYKSLLNCIFEVERDLLQTKNRNISKNLILVFGFYKRRRNG